MVSKRVSKKLVSSLQDIDAAILLINAIDPQLPTVKLFHEAIEHLPHILVLNKVDTTSVIKAQEIIDKFGEDMLLASMIERRGIGGIKKAIAGFPKGKVAILGIFNSGKTSLINILSGDTAPVSDIPGTTLIVTPHRYKGWELLDTIGDIWDINKPLMFSIDLVGCDTVQSKIEQCLNEEIKGLTASLSICVPALVEAVAIMKKCIENGNKIIVCGAGASALVAMEIAGQGQETGVPILVFTNDFTTHQPVSFAKGFAEDDLAMSEYSALAVNKGDVIIGISASGGTAFTHELLRLGRNKGAKTIAITENIDTPLGKYADIIIKSNAKPEGPSSSKIQTTHLAIGHALMITLADERGITAEKSIQYMLPKPVPSKKMGIK